jgi:hypothetical protein
MRRLVLVVGASVLLVLGFGAAFVPAGGLNGHEPVRICHKPGTDDEETITVDDDAVAQAHLAHGDYLGPCRTVATTETSTSTTLTSVTSTTLPITVTDPPTTITRPAETTTTGITDTVTVPPETTTVPATTTIVTVPPGSTTTVTLPGQTVTEPAVTTTIPDEIIERPPETVTLPGATTTVAAAGTTTVVTFTGPHEIVHPGLVVKKLVQAKITQPRRLVHIAGRIHRQLARARYLVVKVIVTVRRTVIVAGRAGAAATRGCPAGTALSHGQCNPIVRGKG